VYLQKLKLKGVKFENLGGWKIRGLLPKIGTAKSCRKTSTFSCFNCGKAKFSSINLQMVTVAINWESKKENIT
jgi:hypothetical protein